MIKDIKNNIKAIKYVLMCCKLYPFWSILYIIDNVLNAVVKVSMVAEIIDMVTDALKTDNPMSLFGSICSRIIFYLIIFAVLAAYRSFYATYIHNRYQVRYTNKIFGVVFKKVKTIDFADFDNPDFYDMYSRAVRDGVRRGILAYRDFVEFINAIAKIVALGAFIVVTDFWLIIIVLLSSIIRIIVGNKKNKNIMEFDRDSEYSRRIYNYVNRTFYVQRFAAELKTTPISDLLISRCEDAQKDIDDLCVKAIKKNSFLSVAGSSFNYILELGGIYLYLGYNIFKGLMKISSFASVLSAATQFSNDFASLANFIKNVKNHSMYINYLNEFMDYVPSLENTGMKELNVGFESLEIKNVTFSYPNTDFNSLNNVNLKIKKGEKLAIVGLNGAGKTTLIKMFLKFYNPNTGDIYFNSQTIRETKEDDIRKKFAIVFQDYRLYAVSIAENVLMRKVETEEDERRVWDALEKVGLTEKVKEYPDGIHTIQTRELNEKGAAFSGGQLQRLAIARVFASDADVYILDEPTSALDPIAERNINNLIIEKSKDKTIIIIAHRLSTVVDTDKIILIENGSIVEEGSHKELLEAHKFYEKMFNTQASLYVRKDE